MTRSGSQSVRSSGNGHGNRHLMRLMVFDTLFGKKKKELKASCKITKEPIEKGYGYMLTTAQVITSKKYWDMIMTEPETLCIQ